MARKRIKWLDFAKGFTILLVVICHSLVINPHLRIQGKLSLVVMSLIDVVIMPSFFAISGFLYRRTTNVHQYLLLIYKKLISLLFPYLLFSVINVWLLEKQPGIGSYLATLWQPLSYLWFLYSLFFIFLIVGGLDLMRLSFGFQLGIALVLALFQTRLIWWNGGNFSINPVASVLGYLLFFDLGRLLSRPQMLRMVKVIARRFAWRWILVMLFGLLFVIQIRQTGITYNPDQVSLVDLPSKLVSILVTLVFSIHRRPGRLFSYFVNYGQQTLVIYLIHYPLVHLIHIFLRGLKAEFPVLETVLTLILAWTLSILLCQLTVRNRYLKFCFYPRHFISAWVKKTRLGRWLLS